MESNSPTDAEVAREKEALKWVMIQLGVSREQSQAMSETVDIGFGPNEILEILPKFRRRDNSSLETASCELLRLIRPKKKQETAEQILGLIKLFGVWNDHMVEQRLHQGAYKLNLNSYRIILITVK